MPREGLCSCVKAYTKRTGYLGPVRSPGGEKIPAPCRAIAAHPPLWQKGSCTGLLIRLSRFESLWGYSVSGKPGALSGLFLKLFRSADRLRSAIPERNSFTERLILGYSITVVREILVLGLWGFDSLYPNDTALWCNGGTSAFGSDRPGSSPGGAAYRGPDL